MTPTAPVRSVLARDDRALACFELASLARGPVVLDALVKRAPVVLRHAARHSGGKYVIVFDGDVASVEESWEAGLEVVGDALLDRMKLARAHELLWEALEGRLAAPTGEAVLMVETSTVACALEHLDHVLKLVPTAVVDLHLAAGIAGRGYFAVEAPLHDLQFARDELAMRIPAGRQLGLDIIARPHPEMLVAFGQTPPFGI